MSAECRDARSAGEFFAPGRFFTMHLASRSLATAPIPEMRRRRDPAADCKRNARLFIFIFVFISRRRAALSGLLALVSAGNPDSLCRTWPKLAFHHAASDKTIKIRCQHRSINQHFGSLNCRRVTVATRCESAWQLAALPIDWFLPALVCKFSMSWFRRRIVSDTLSV